MARIAAGQEWARLLVGVVIVYALFHGAASTLGSDRGQAGVVVGAIVVASTLVAERVLFGGPTATAVRAVGFARPRVRGIATAVGLGVLLLLVFPTFTAITGTRLGVDPLSASLLPGLFAQAVIAEEVLFRGFLFRRVRVGRPFWRAALLAGVPFVAVHFVLLFTLPWLVALAAIILSAILSAPFAYLFELGGDTIWAPAFVHFIIQGAIKLVVPLGSAESLPAAWMVASAVVPYLVFLVPSHTFEGAK